MGLFLIDVLPRGKELDGKFPTISHHDAKFPIDLAPISHKNFDGKFPIVVGNCWKFPMELFFLRVVFPLRFTYILINRFKSRTPLLVDYHCYSFIKYKFLIAINCSGYRLNELWWKQTIESATQQQWDCIDFCTCWMRNHLQMPSIKVYSFSHSRMYIMNNP